MAATLLINRSGLMVMTFLSLYLINEFDYSVAKAGFAVSFYGWGSLVGVWLGGLLAERIGYLRIQFLALISSGLVFISMYFATEYWHFIALSFLVSATADTFRPANMASIPWYSTEENRKRSIALIRLAINLGISIGPAVGGFLALSIGYDALFWVDGLTCISAGIFLLSFLGLKDPEHKEADTVPTQKSDVLDDSLDTILIETKELSSAEAEKSALTKFYYLLISIFLWAFLFFQLIYMFPVFMKEELLFNELTIGLFFTFNGLLIVATEMPIVHQLQNKPVLPILKTGIILCAISFLFLIFGEPLVLIFPVLYILFVTFGEVLYLPFTNSVALDLTPSKNQAKYMGYYALAFSLSHVLGPLVGAFVADHYGFQILWIGCAVLMVLVLALTSSLKYD